ncbi:MAG: trehalose-phosphatase [Acidimicrobiales bacterium]
MGGPVNDELEAELEHLARTPQLLIACDYDGTIAPIVDDPMAATPRPDTVVALRALAALANTHVAIISGRSLRDLAGLSRLPTEIHLVGSHGGEFDLGFGKRLSPRELDLRAHIKADLTDIAARTPGSELEVKPAAVTFHYRRSDRDDVRRALQDIEAGPAALDGVRTHYNVEAVELLVVDTDKGRALESLRHRVGASAVLFFGDSPTDEHAFATLRGPDVGVRVGVGDTLARHHVEDTAGVAEALARLAQLRTEWVTGAGAVAIADHSLLSDQRTAAIVTPDGRITWYCAPRIDSSAVFAELVGGPAAGYFAVCPADGGEPTSQRYIEDTMVLETRWSGFTLTDYLDTSGGRPDRLAGRSDLFRVIEGRGRVRIEFAPRLDFGRHGTRLAIRDGGVEVVDTADLMVLRSPGVQWELTDDGRHHTARAVVDLADEPVVLEFRYGTASTKPDSRTEDERRADTRRFWQGWADELTVPDVEPELVRRSALALKALCHGPTGAIVAAATTSLPESVGGIRNWDYRYCWLRDAALTAGALARLGSYSEAMAFLDWVLGILEHRDDPERLHPLYLVTGRHLPPEADIAELAGYAGSRPVRVGNAAERQVQLDVFGPIVDLIWLLATEGAPLSGQHWQLVQAMVGAVEKRWLEPDHGIWEVRRSPRHHVHSKVMCWVTVDRALRVADDFVDGDHRDWELLRDKIRDDVLERGWKDDVGAFTAAYDGTDIDASVLAVGLYGLVDSGDDRYLRTVDTVERELREGSTVFRYRGDDGLPGAEGGFHLMTAWLVDAYLATNREADARELFGGLAAAAGQTGLLSEEIDPITGRSLGNHPQAYSHLGLIHNALNLAAYARDGRPPADPEA